MEQTADGILKDHWKLQWMDCQRRLVASCPFSNRLCPPPFFSLYLHSKLSLTEHHEDKYLPYHITLNVICYLCTLFYSLILYLQDYPSQKNTGICCLLKCLPCFDFCEALVTLWILTVAKDELLWQHGSTKRVLWHGGPLLHLVSNHWFPFNPNHDLSKILTM